MTLQECSLILASANIVSSLFIYLSTRKFNKAIIYTTFVLVLVNLAVNAWYSLYTKQPALIVSTLFAIVLSNKSIKRGLHNGFNN